jgi:hypothetical protein
MEINRRAALTLAGGAFLTSLLSPRRGSAAGLGIGASEGLRANTRDQETLLLSGRIGPDSYAAVALDANGVERWRHVMPGRAHGVHWRPDHPQAVVVARRPGFWMEVLDGHDGSVLATMEPPAGRHFQGHADFLADGRLVTTENAYDEKRAVLGLWEITPEGQPIRVAEWDAGGVGAHDVLVNTDGSVLWVAIGGILTHPDMGRTKLNLPTMNPALVELDATTGDVRRITRLDPSLHQLGIRHLAEAPDGSLCAALQYEGPAEDYPSLAMVVRPDGTPMLLDMPQDMTVRCRNYTGDVAVNAEGSVMALSCPRGNAVLLWDPRDGRYLGHRETPDLCALGTLPDGRVVGAGGDGAVRFLETAEILKSYDPLVSRWDNHLAAGLG